MPFVHQPFSIFKKNVPIAMKPFRDLLVAFLSHLYG